MFFGVGFFALILTSSSTVVDLLPAHLYNENESSFLVSQNNFIDDYDSKHVYLLDVREDEERDIGFLPNSVHIRHADILAGDWELLPKDKKIYVLCYSAGRGGEVADFLQSKGFSAFALSGGVNEWKDNGGVWEGALSFSHEPRVKELYKELSFEEVSMHQINGALLVDAREPKRVAWWTVPGSIPVGAYFASSEDMNEVLSRVPVERPVVLLCDGIRRACFSALITALKLEERGYDVLGKISDLEKFKD
jgi:rhodanese-related sulfurtransferase